MVARLLGRCRLLAQSPEHSAGQRQQVGALGLAPRAILVRPIGYISLLAVRHSSDERNLTDVTGSYKVSRGYWGGGRLDPPWPRRSGCCACPGWWPSPAERWSKPGRRWPEPADLNTAPRNPGGCLMVQGALAREEASDSIRQELAACRSTGDAAIRKRLQRAKSKADLSTA